jgi:NADH:ubiquinone oxidoreductase subunit
MTLGTRLYTWLRGEQVGSDAAGNRYYRDRSGASRADGLREKRWVIYNGEVEASRVPPEWHGWLHHAVNDPPPPGGPAMRPWQKPHRPNATGTAEAYRPAGHDFSGGRRPAATGDYEPGKPA